MTTFEARRTKAGIASVGGRLDALENVDEAERRQIPELIRTVERAQALVAAGPDEATVRQNKIETRIAELQARLDTLADAVGRRSRERAEASTRFAKRLAALEQTDAQLADKVALSLPDDKEQLWQQAMALLASGQREQGRRYCQTFIQRFPQDGRASRAYLSVGVSYADEARYANAAAAFQRLLATYPRSPEAPEAMWQLSQAFGHLSFCKDERALLRNLVERFPKSRPAADATKALNSLSRSSNACVS